MNTIDNIIQELANKTNSILMNHTDRANKCVIVYTTRPGYLIGKAGCLYEETKAQLAELGYDYKIQECEEIHMPGANWDHVISERVKARLEQWAMEDNYEL